MELLLPAAAIATLMLATWLISLAKGDVSIVDSIWGLGFILAAWTATLTVIPAESLRPASLLLPGLITIWGLRLAAYLTWRGWGEPEDYRYAAMRKRGGSTFPLLSLLVVFGLQGVLMWIVALPLLTSAGAAHPLSWVDGLGTAIFLGGFLWETIADQQLARFKADPANRGKLLTTGLWSVSRHPNYFGEFVLWWGLFVVAVGRGAPPWTVLSPLLMAFLLLKVSGVPLLEKRLERAGEAYAEYAARTPAFFPGRPHEPS